MGTPLRVLIVEDSAADAGLMAEELKGGGFEPDWHRVEDTASLREALVTSTWDVVLSDYSIPGLGGLEALRLVRESGLDLPFLIVSGVIGEETAVAGMKAGANDYLLKHNLARLAPAVQRELREAEARSQRRRAEARLRESEERLRLAMEVAQLGTWSWDLPADNISWASETYVIFGLAPEGFAGKHEAFLTLVHPEDRSLVARATEAALRGEPLALEFRVVRPDRSVRWVRSQGKAFKDGAGNVNRVLGVVQDVTARRLAELDREAYAGRLRVLSREILKAQENERRHLARELHDEIGQGLTAVRMSLEAAQRRGGGENAEAVALLGKMLQQVRDLALELRPSVLDDLGLDPAVRWLVTRMAGRSNQKAEVVIDMRDRRLSPEVETVCYRVVQESLTNAARHARAGHVRVELRTEGAGTMLAVVDDGDGFDVAAAWQRASAGGSLGLLSMRERVALAGGTFDVRSGPGRGTTVEARFAGDGS